MKILKQLRYDSGLKSKKVAEILGISRVQLNNLENGLYKISEDKIIKLSIIYNIDKDNLEKMIKEEKGNDKNWKEVS